MTKRKKLIFFARCKILYFVFLLLFKICYGQQVALRILNEDGRTVKKLKFEKKLKDDFLAKILKNYENKGFFDAYFVYDSIGRKADFFCGKKYFFEKLYILDSLPQVYFGSAIVEKISIRKYLSLSEKILEYAENNGYPFAALNLKTVAFGENSLTAELSCQKGSFIRFDSLQVSGDTKLKTSFLKKYLRLKPGEDFCEEKIRQAEKLLSEFAFVSAKPEIKISFKDDRALGKVLLRGEKYNSFDGIVGLQPNQYGANLSFTGQVNLELNNLFASAKTLSFLWNRLKPRSQQLQFFYTHPQFLGLPLDFSLHFEQLKEDTIFSNVRRGISFSHYRPQIGRFSFGAIWNDANLLSSAKKFTADAPLTEGKMLLYLFSYQLRRTDNNVLPMRGYTFGAEMRAGNKSMLRSPFADSTSLNLLPTKAAYFDFRAHLHIFSRISKRLVWAEKMNFAMLEGGNVAQNDFYRIGGLKTLRGFNEFAVFSKQYLLHTTELRLMTERQSYFFIFTDNAVSKNFSGSEFFFGAGAGLSLKLNNGIFNFVYALGNSREQKASLQNSKVHFGFVSRF
jgi:outer membrane protein assembly factor BamA